MERSGLDFLFEGCLLSAFFLLMFLCRKQARNRGGKVLGSLVFKCGLYIHRVKEWTSLGVVYTRMIPCTILRLISASIFIRRQLQPFVYTFEEKSSANHIWQ